MKRRASTAARLGLVLAAATAAGAAAAPIPAQDVTVMRNVAFAERDGKPLRLDLYRPQVDRPVPFGIVIHGGGWRRGSRYHPDAIAMCRLLNATGIAAASVSYRLAPGAVYPAQIEDCRAALQFLREHALDFGLDAQRVVAMGASAGGHLAALLGTQDDSADPAAPAPEHRQSTRPQCVVTFFAPSNILPSPTMTRRGERLVRAFLGRQGSGPEDIAVARQASPVCHVTADDVPMLMVHGTEDHIVPLWHSREMTAALTTAGVAAELMEIPGGSHGDFVVRGVIELHRGGEAPKFWTRAQRFMRRQLRLPAKDHRD
ncbi:MAG: alpha/beta hydrolase [Planctomycetota bacterium]